jgi:2-polyprenyl-3-methyl-5-hydroxy-6-metoxy-1,4-benzoquinol methylase
MPGREQGMDARSAWNAGAEAWRKFVETGADYYRLYVHGPALLAHCLPVTGRRALDLGCGEGYFSRELARAGARVVGVDLSDALVRFAEEREQTEPLGVEYRNMDARDVASHWPPRSFDLLTACMSLQDMDDAGAVLRAGVRVLEPGGHMVFSVPHPCTDTPLRVWERDATGAKVALKIDRYFETGAAVCDWNMPRLAYRWTTPFRRHTLEEWFRLITDADLTIRGLSEPRPSVELVRQHPQLADCARLPYFLIIDAVSGR